VEITVYQGLTTWTDQTFFFVSFPGYGYGHPGGFNPFLLNAGWLDAAYMNYAWSDYFRVQQTHPLLSKGEWFFSINFRKIEHHTAVVSRTIKFSTAAPTTISKLPIN
jgi:hypothetical protein